MPQFLETIKIYRGEIPHLAFHNERLNRTRAHFYPHSAPIDLAPLLNPLPPEIPHETVIRCRLLYRERIDKIEYYPYQRRSIQRIQLLEAPTLRYRYKYADRREIDTLYQQRGCADEILITQQGYLTDTSIANIALFDGLRWLTPQTPLLPGTKRAQLLTQGVLTPAAIHYTDLPNFSKISLFNGMVEFKEQLLPIEALLPYR